MTHWIHYDFMKEQWDSYGKYLQRDEPVYFSKLYSESCHERTNHEYDGQPYSVHLTHVIAIANKFITLIPEEKFKVVLSACWAHDVIEDTRQTYNDVKKAIGEKAADIVYALTNEKGKNRAERENDKYFEGIRNTPYATFVKLCDRIANVEYSIKTHSRMLEAYRKEMDGFVSRLYCDEYAEMFQYLKSLI